MTMNGLLHFSLSTLIHSSKTSSSSSLSCSVSTLQVLVVQSPAPPSLTQIKEQPPSPGSPSAEMYSGGTQIYLQVKFQHNNTKFLPFTSLSLFHSFETSESSPPIIFFLLPSIHLSIVHH